MYVSEYTDDAYRLTLLAMWDCYKYSDQSVAPNAAHPHFPPDAEVIGAHNQKIAIRQVAGVAGARAGGGEQVSAG